eukprot:scaffold47856_cov53-Prasinocladus_malaysianus.AAC.1
MDHSSGSDGGHSPEEREQFSGSSQHTSPSEQAGSRFRGRKTAQPHRVQKLSDPGLDTTWEERGVQEESSPHRQLHGSFKSSQKAPTSGQHGGVYMGNSPEDME